MDISEIVPHHPPLRGLAFAYLNGLQPAAAALSSLRRCTSTSSSSPSLPMANSIAGTSPWSIRLPGGLSASCRVTAAAERVLKNASSIASQTLTTGGTAMRKHRCNMSLSAPLTRGQDCSVNSREEVHILRINVTPTTRHRMIGNTLQKQIDW